MRAPGPSTALRCYDMRGGDDGGRTRVVKSSRRPTRSSYRLSSSSGRCPDAARKARPINALDRTARRPDTKIDAASG